MKIAVINSLMLASVAVARKVTFLNLFKPRFSKLRVSCIFMIVIIGTAGMASAEDTTPPEAPTGMEVSLEPWDDDSGGAADAVIDAVFLAQTHVSRPTDPYFKLTGDRQALLKVHVISPSGGQAPVVSAKVSSGGSSTDLTLQGPGKLPTALPSAPGKVQHSFSDSFTVIIPAKWVKQGMRVNIQAGASSVSHDINVGAPNPIPMKMFDVHYFKESSSDYPVGYLQELEAKWPVSDLTVERVRNIIFPELVIPARPDVGTPHVRIKSKDEYKEKTGQNFDGEQAAALQWVEALSAGGGNFDVAMCYINITGVHAGGQAGGFDGVGVMGGVGILHHELGHALGLPHWGNSASYPYRGDMYGIPAPPQEVHVGPNWGFDMPSLTFIPPTVQKDIDFAYKKGMYKVDPMQGGGTGKQEPPFLMNHFSDYSVYKMQNYIEGKLAVLRPDGYYKWSEQSGDYTKKMTGRLGVRYPIEHDVEVISVMAACTLSDKSVSMVYPPIGPYKGNRILTFDPSNAADRSTAKNKQFCPDGGCDFSLRVVQGGQQKIYMLPASGDAGSDPYEKSSLKTAAVNLRADDGAVTKAELLLTPDADSSGLPVSPEVLDVWIGKVGGDQCPGDPNKTQPGQCGCGAPDTDDDGDGVPICFDECPWDGQKLVPGECGCGQAEGSCAPPGRYEAEESTAAQGATCSTGSNSGYTGTGYMDYGGDGTWVEWGNVTVSGAGNYTLSFRYAAGSGQRPSDVIVNGSKVGRIAFRSTGRWDSWQTEDVTVALRAGNNTIRVVASGSGGPNLDHLHVR